MRIYSFALAACTVAAASAVAARVPASSAECSSATQPAAVLARLVYPETLNRAITTYTLVHIVTPTYHADKELKQLEADHPGIIDAMIAAMRPEFERGRREALPQLWEKTCDVYASGLSPEDLRQAIAFLASPAGQRLARARREAVEHALPPDASLRPDRASTVASKDTQEQDAFRATATGRKFEGLQARIDAIVSVWNEAPTPEADRRVSEAMSRAAASFYDSEPEPVRLIPTPAPAGASEAAAK
jgi:hypothetical protein